MALVLAIMLLLVLFVMGSTLLMMTTTDVRIAGHQMRDNRALFVADAGIQEVLARITSDTLYIGDTVGYVRNNWQSEIYAGVPPAGGGDTLRFKALLADTGLKYADFSSPVIVHYLKDRIGDVIYYDPETKKRSTGASVPTDGLPIYVAEATGLEPSGGYPVRRRAITEFVISSAAYDSFNYALHTGRGIYFKAPGRLSTFSTWSDSIKIVRYPGTLGPGDTLFIDTDGDGVYSRATEANFFRSNWVEGTGPFNLDSLPNTSAKYPPPGAPGNPDLSKIGSNGAVFANGEIWVDSVNTSAFSAKLGPTVATGDTNYWIITQQNYLYSFYLTSDSVRVPQIDLSMDYWRYQGAKIIQRVNSEDSIPSGWVVDQDGYHWTQNGAKAEMDSGLYYFSDLPVTIDTAFSANGDTRIITPFSVVISRDVTYDETDPKIICFMAGQDVILTGDVLVKAVLYAKSGDLKIMNEAVILGAALVGGKATISGKCVIFLDGRLNDVGFQFVEPEKRYVSTVLSWREVRP
jgi:hypothetical protein